MGSGEQHTNYSSDYSAYSHGNMMATSSGFLYSQSTVPTDLSGSVWDAEGTQNFHGDGNSDEFPFSFGHITPRGHGQDQNEAVDDISSKWIATEEAPVTAAEPMRRISSRSSSGSQRHRTLKASHKSHPKIMNADGSHMSSLDMTGNGQIDYFLHDADVHSVSQMFYPMPMGLSADGLPYSADILSSGLSLPQPQQHMDPTHLQLDFDPSLGGSPTNSWGSSPSPPESRTSSPGLPEEAWTNVPVGVSPTQSQSSPTIGVLSPSLSHHPGNGLVMSDDLYGTENAFLPPPFTRRSSGEGESSARDHPLYKNGTPKSDGLFHCPWEGHASCNHKPEKLKCNYDKFVDSHLKPYRCKIETCENARFSSTACLLRHEREAHAMHGHGDKPYLCTYDGCDRAVPGCGFPRNWNLRDHMRRVHNDNGQSLNMTNASSSGRASHSHTTKGRKRKSKESTESTSSGRKGSSKNVDDAAAAARVAEMALSEEWSEHRRALDDYLLLYNNPAAFEVLDQLPAAQDHLAAMEKISRKLKKARRDHYSRPTLSRTG